MKNKYPKYYIPIGTGWDKNLMFYRVNKNKTGYTIYFYKYTDSGKSSVRAFCDYPHIKRYVKQKFLRETTAAEIALL